MSETLVPSGLTVQQWDENTSANTSTPTGSSSIWAQAHRSMIQVKEDPDEEARR